MGDALTLPTLKAALAIENGLRSRGLSHCRRVYFIITWHSTSTEMWSGAGIANVSRRARHCLSRRV